MLLAQRLNWALLPDAIKSALEFVICDDASDPPIDAEPLPHAPRERLFRIHPPHVMWSQCCATNIAVHHASHPWLVVTDIDHVIPADTFRYLLNMVTSRRADERVAYRFERQNVDGSAYKPHPNSWFMHARLFAATGGHDERLRGLYNQDGTFIERVGRVALRIERLPVPLMRVGRETIPDASTPAAFRDPEDRKRMAREVAKRKEHWKRDGTYWTPYRLSAAYGEIT